MWCRVTVGTEHKQNGGNLSIKHQISLFSNIIIMMYGYSIAVLEFYLMAIQLSPQVHNQGLKQVAAANDCT